MQTAKFKSKMAYFGDTVDSLSNAMNIHRITLSNKMKGTQQFTQHEIGYLIDHWNLTPHELVQIFFDNN